MDPIKSEQIEGENEPEGFLPNLPAKIPPNFEEEEWDVLTRGFVSRADEVSHTLYQRGGGGSKKGRPTNFTIPYKGNLSDSARAIEQRNRAALRTEEESAITKAEASDRSAKYQLKKKIEKDSQFQLLSKKEQEKKLDAKLEDLAGKRFAEKKSAEWLEHALRSVKKKWDNIEHEIDMRAHKLALTRSTSAPNSLQNKSNTTRAESRVYGRGGAFEKVLRSEYQRGLQLLQSNGFKTQEQKDDWVEFRDSLSAKELAMVTDQHWQRRSPTPPPEFASDVMLYANRPYVKGRDDDECEEELEDSGEELEAYFESMPNEYEDEEDKDMDMAATKDQEVLSKEWESCSDSTWEGFSDPE